jgi:hypothetical protein
MLLCGKNLRKSLKPEVGTAHDWIVPIYLVRVSFDYFENVRITGR